MAETVVILVMAAIILTPRLIRYRWSQRRRPNQIPRFTPVMWRSDWYLVYLIIGMLITLRLMYYYERGSLWSKRVSPPDWVRYVEAGAGVILGVCGVILAYRRVHWKKRALQFNYELCPHCAYPLKGLPATHKCPECGKPFDLYKVKRDWNQATKK